MAFAVHATEPPAQEATAIPPDQTIARELPRDEEHRYQLALKAGECVRVVVEQRGMDVIVQARGPGDAVIEDVQEEITSRGHEDVDIVAGTAGIYTFTVKPAPGIIVPGAYAIRVDRRRPASDADRTMQDARTLRTTAAHRLEQDDIAGAAPLLERALTLTEGVRGAADREVAGVAAQLADVYLDLRDTAKAEPLYGRALAIMDQTLGREHPIPAYVRSRLARLYQLTGERLKAEALIRPALEVIEATLGSDHLLYVRSLITLETLRDNAGDFEHAGEILRRQLAIMDRIGYADSVLYTQVLSGLGGIYNTLDDPRAGDVLQRALTLCERLRGSDSNCVVNPLVNLGVFERQRGDNATAEAHYRRAIAIRERILGPDNRDLIPMLNNLANVYHADSDDAQALETHYHALRIEERAVGPYHRYTQLSTGNLAIIYAATGDVARAIEFQRRTDTILERQLTLNLAVGSERQKVAFARSVSERTDRTISLHLLETPSSPDAGALAALVVLQRKGRVLDVMIDTFAAAHQRVTDPRDRTLRDQLHTTAAQLARYALNAPEGLSPEVRQAQMKGLEAQTERLESEIGERDAEFRAHTQPVTLPAVQAAIPEQAALLEFAIFRPFDPRADQNRDAYGPPHYAAYVIRRDAAPRGVDLGPARAIDETIAALRQALRDPTQRDLRQRARAVEEQVMQPLYDSVGDARQLLVSPDGELNLVPFDALIDRHGRYLIERYAITYLTSGRDLLRMQVARTSRSAPLIVADPLFGEPSLARNTPASIALASVRAVRRGRTTDDDLSGLYFAPLAGTAAEGRAIKGLFPEATLLTGPQATKAALQRVEAPLMLHVASHGFFLRRATGDQSSSSAAAPTAGTSQGSATVPVENPLLRSGLALAGANLTGDAHDAGILTALEASGLNLWGTKLVTLSACDTGIGEVRNGEGVYGLRRAFVLAGAETVVMSLWPVSDYMTRQMMTAYYTGLRAALGRGDALRQAKLSMLRRRGRQHPFYWASFIQSGEWGTLEGRR